MLVAQLCLIETVACQALLSMGFSTQEYWSVPFPSPGHLLDPGVELTSPAWQAEFSPLSQQGSPMPQCCVIPQHPSVRSRCIPVRWMHFYRCIPGVGPRGSQCLMQPKRHQLLLLSSASFHASNKNPKLQWYLNLWKGKPSVLIPAFL